MRYEDVCARTRYQGQGQVIASHNICGMQLLVPVVKNYFWHTNPHTRLTSKLQSDVCNMNYGTHIPI